MNDIPENPRDGTISLKSSKKIAMQIGRTLHDNPKGQEQASSASSHCSPSREAVAAKIRVERPYREAGKWWRNVTFRMTETDANKIAADAELMTVKW